MQSNCAKIYISFDDLKYYRILFLHHFYCNTFPHNEPYSATNCTRLYQWSDSLPGHSIFGSLSSSMAYGTEVDVPVRPLWRSGSEGVFEAHPGRSPCRSLFLRLRLPCSMVDGEGLSSPHQYPLPHLLLLPLIKNTWFVKILFNKRYKVLKLNIILYTGLFSPFCIRKTDCIVDQYKVILALTNFDRCITHWIGSGAVIVIRAVG